MTTPNSEKPLALICHPYLFALKEGRDISGDLLDYNLLLLQRNCSEVIKSPKIPNLRFRVKKPSLPLPQQK